MDVAYLADHRQFIPLLARWYDRACEVLFPGGSFKARMEALAFSCGRREVPTVIVALRNGALLGSAMLVVHDMQGRMELSPWLAGVFVSPDHRREGVGTALVRRATDEARALGVAKLHLYTAGGEDFYARFGWRVMERGYVYKGTEVTVMSCCV
jgi:predicted N-acetyltransferase YhbS